MDQVDEAKNLGDAVVDRKTEQGFTRYRPCPYPQRHQTATYIPCQDCDVRSNPELNTEAKHELREQKRWAVHILFTAETIVYVDAPSFFDACHEAEELDIEDLNLADAHISTTKAMNATEFPALAAAQETK